MQPAAPTPEYEDALRTVLAARDWEALREHSRTHNQIPDDVYNMDRHFWEVLLHKADPLNTVSRACGAFAS